MKISTVAIAVVASGCAVSITAIAQPAAAGPQHRQMVAATNGGIPSSYGLVGEQGSLIQAITDLGQSGTTGEPQSAKFASEVLSTAISPDGATALFAEDNALVGQLLGLRQKPSSRRGTGPRFGPGIDLSQYAGEGSGYAEASSTGVAISGHAALVAVDESGVVQLIEKGGRWKIDKRVRFKGRNAIGQPHAAGFIPITKYLGTPFEGVVISPVPLPNGKYVGLARQEGNDVIAVIVGVGTAHPKVTGAFKLPSFDGDDGSGNSAMAFDDLSAEHALVGSAYGLLELNMSHPNKPTLSHFMPGQFPNIESVAIDPAGDQAVIGTSDGTVYTFHAKDGVPSTMQGTGSGFGRVIDLGYTANGKLFVDYQPDPSTSQDDFGQITDPSSAGLAFDMVAGWTQPLAAPDTLSLFPAYQPSQIDPSAILRGAQVGHHVSTALHVSGGIGPWHVVSAKGLPPGITRHGSTLSGSPRRSGSFSVTITAINKAGTPTKRNYSVKVGG